MSNRQLPIGASAAARHASRFTFHVSRITFHVSRITHHASRVTHRAFTLVEILVTMALLSFIMVGLFAAFNQVQRAFRSSMSQVDRLEAGRAVTELLPRDIEQITPCGGNARTFNTLMVGSSPPYFTPLTQSLPGTTLVRTNLLQDCFLLTRQNQTWVGIGYCVRVSDANGHLLLPGTGLGQLGVGSLYRFVTTTNVLQSNGTRSDPGVLYTNFLIAAQSGSAAISNRICDGVIHFYLGAYAINGFPFFSDGSHTNVYFQTNALGASPPYYYSTVHPARAIAGSSYPGNLAELRFWSNAVPAAVEMQLGILEQPAWERYNSIPVPAARLAYLQRPDVASRVHLFRQRVPIRNVDPLAYQ
jgi:prepilin-type N-terminal cleavage/methylation domain-containing protein